MSKRGTKERERVIEGKKRGEKENKWREGEGVE